MLTDVKVMSGPASDLAYMSDDELVSDLKQAIAMTVLGIVRASRIWVELERRGHDLSEFRSSLQRYLPRVAAGLLAPEAVVEFMGDPRRLDTFSRLDGDTQRAVLSRKTITVYDVTQDKARETPLGAISHKEMKLAVDQAVGTLRTAEQQRLMSVREQRSNVDKLTRLMVPAGLSVRLRESSSQRGMTVPEFIRSMMDQKGTAA